MTPRLRQDPVHTLFAWITAHLDDAAQSRLIELLAAKSEPFAQDNEAAPSFDPMQTKRVGARAIGEPRVRREDGEPRGALFRHLAHWARLLATPFSVAHR